MDSAILIPQTKESWVRVFKILWTNVQYQLQQHNILCSDSIPILSAFVNTTFESWYSSAVCLIRYPKPEYGSKLWLFLDEKDPSLKKAYLNTIRQSQYELKKKLMKLCASFVRCLLWY